MYYGGRLFRPVTTSKSSQVGEDTIFKYEQTGDMVTATYSGGDISFGQIIGRAGEDGVLNLRYQHMDRGGALKTGVCKTTPVILPGGKMRLHEQWRWTCGDQQEGESILEEI